eukprot:907532-Prorocentrum_minimum.AAC.2
MICTVGHDALFIPIHHDSVRRVEPGVLCFPIYEASFSALIKACQCGLKAKRRSDSAPGPRSPSAAAGASLRPNAKRRSGHLVHHCATSKLLCDRLRN